MQRQLGYIATFAFCLFMPFRLLAAPELRQPRSKPFSVRTLSPRDAVTSETPRDALARLKSLPAPASAAAPVVDGRVAGGPVPPGSPVYRNESIEPAIYGPGEGFMVAEAIALASGPCNLVFYNILVAGSNDSGATFDVHTELWNGDPCLGGSTVIQGTQHDFPGVVNDGSVVELQVFLDTAPIPIPKNLYVTVTFTGPGADEAGWLVADQAELGFTPNDWVERKTGVICDEFFFGCVGAYAGFWTTLNCNITTPQIGACCNGATCTEVTQANCTTGVWQGPFTSCNPNLCAPGACCTGNMFDACEETTANECADGLFLPNATCTPTSPCPAAHTEYANTYPIEGFHRADAGVKRADDVTLKSNQPCELAGYEILVVGNGDIGPDHFNATLELWTNDDNEIDTELDDTPLALIPGTARTFKNVPADFCTRPLVAGPFSGIILPRKLWVAISTDSGLAGPFIAGPAKLGSSFDAFAEFNTLMPNAWQPGFFFGGFNEDGPCPDEPGTGPCPAGSFRIKVWCQGDRPTGACCKDGPATCTDNVTDFDCDGRWVQGATCASNPFDPPCGNNACCFRNPLNPNVIGCLDLSAAGCQAQNGERSPGTFCAEIECPTLACFIATGNCFAARTGKGCENGFCCEAVCAVDDFCCTDRWDASCVATANEICRPPLNDEPAGATPISAQGDTPFDNTHATSSGRDNPQCMTLGDIDAVANDLWYCLTAPCTDLINVSTCSDTDVDTRVAVYNGCAAPPTGQNLLACNDDICGYKGQTAFVATQGQQYLIQVGSFPGAMDPVDGFPVVPVGPGQLSITCAGLNNSACPGTGDCCNLAGAGGPACNDTLCCNIVCECDPFCCGPHCDGGTNDGDSCTTSGDCPGGTCVDLAGTWDEACAGNGFQNSGCGAAVLCPNLCGMSCPTGTVTWVDPPTGVVDARLSLDPISMMPIGIDRIRVQAPAGADDSCWTLCETSNTGTPNSIANVSEVPAVAGGQSVYTLELQRPITPRAVTTITYTNDNEQPSTGGFTAHSGNVNGDALASPGDINALVNFLNAVNPNVNAPWGLFSADIDHSTAVRSGDLVSLVDALNGAGLLDPTINTPKPNSSGICP